MSSRPLAIAAATLASAAVVPALALGGARPAATHTIVLRDIRFHPSSLTIRRGESVTWIWRDGSVEHNVTAKSFRSRTQAHGSFTVRFAHAGTFEYRCTIHEREGMRGRIVVR